MSLYAIGDLHLHFQSVPAAGQQLTDKVWRNHELVFKEIPHNWMVRWRDEF